MADLLLLDNKVLPHAYTMSFCFTRSWSWKISKRKGLYDPLQWQMPSIGHIGCLLRAYQWYLGKYANKSCTVRLDLLLTTVNAFGQLLVNIKKFEQTPVVNLGIVAIIFKHFSNIKIIDVAFNLLPTAGRLIYYFCRETITSPFLSFQILPRFLQLIYLIYGINEILNGRTF